MCRFFTITRSVKVMAAGSLILPFVLMVSQFKAGNTEIAFLFFGWFFGASASCGFGYKIGRLKPCELPHIPENMEVELSRAEGEQSQLRLA